jgi:hypothetical protein
MTHLTLVTGSILEKYIGHHKPLLCVMLMRLIQDGLTHHQTNISLSGKTNTVTTKKGLNVFEKKQGNYPSMEKSCNPYIAYLLLMM